MRLRDIICEGASDQLLYWISPEGRRVDVSGTTHADVIQKECDLDPDSYNDMYEMYDYAYREGWIRVLAEDGSFGADWGVAVEEAALEALANLIMEVDEYNAYFLNDGRPVIGQKRAASIVRRMAKLD